MNKSLRVTLRTHSTLWEELEPVHIINQTELWYESQKQEKIMLEGTCGGHLMQASA